MDDPQDEVEETLRRFGEFVKRTFREASAGERLTTWTNLILVVIAIVAAVIYGRQLTAMQGQLSEMKGSGEQTNRLICLYQQQVAQAREANEETHNLLTATQAAVFQLTVEYESNINNAISGGTGVPSFDISVVNVGKSAAREFSGEIKYIRRSATGKVIQSSQRTFADNTIVVSGSASTRFPIIPSAVDYMAYASDSFSVKSNIHYNDGFNNGRTQTFCKEMAVTQKRGPIWTDCGEAKAWEQIIK
jgi:hypothetical protein